MAIQQKLHTKLVQKLILTPSLQQAIKLLPMSTLELGELLTQEMVENPLLEELPTEEQQQDPAQAAEKAEAKFENGLLTLTMVFSAIWLLIFGIGIFKLGVPPTAEETGRALWFLLATIFYGGIWMALAMLLGTGAVQTFRKRTNRVAPGLGSGDRRRAPRTHVDRL